MAPILRAFYECADFPKEYRGRGWQDCLYVMPVRQMQNWVRVLLSCNEANDFKDINF